GARGKSQQGGPTDSNGVGACSCPPPQIPGGAEGLGGSIATRRPGRRHRISPAESFRGSGPWKSEGRRLRNGKSARFEVNGPGTCLGHGRRRTAIRKLAARGKIGRATIFPHARSSSRPRSTGSAVGNACRLPSNSGVAPLRTADFRGGVGFTTAVGGTSDRSR